MARTQQGRAGQNCCDRAKRWLCAGAILCVLASSPLAANPARIQADCPSAKVWVTQRLPSGALSSTWQTPVCGTAQAGVADVVVSMDPARRRQRMLGFGAALTGSAAWLLANRVPAAQRKALVQSLFAPPPGGIGLSLLRLPVGSTDLSRRRYSLAPVPPAADADEVALDLAPMRDATLPVLRDILKVNPGLRIIASPWSPPAWMKTTDSLIGGSLKPSQEQRFAKYIAGFVEAMHATGVPIFAVTLQNEPGYSPADYPGMRMDAPQRARIVADALGPLLARQSPTTTILGWDDNWDRFKQPLQVLADPAAAPYLGGIAWHCYIGRPNVQDIVHAHYPDKWQLVTECSDGTWSPNSKESIADFVNRVLIRPARHWGAGTILWSLALDADHGPHDGGCGRCIGVVTIGPDGRVEPTRDYYALAHFSAFVAPGAYQVETTSSDNALASVGFISADRHALTVVLANRGSGSRGVRIALAGAATSTAVALPAQSVATVQIQWVPDAVVHTER